MRRVEIVDETVMYVGTEKEDRCFQDKHEPNTALNTAFAVTTTTVYGLLHSIPL